jgi:hypothetical protein
MSAVLDEEMQRLPDKCRAVLAACYLEGLTRDEAARGIEVLMVAPVLAFGAVLRANDVTHGCPLRLTISC